MTYKTLNILLFFLLTFVSVGMKAQSTQQGVVLEYHEKTDKTPIGNVAIAATNAGATTSDDKGEFTLRFRTLKPGDGIQFRRIERNGYEVMNREAVEVMRISSKSNTAPIQIVLCNSTLLSQLRDGYRSVTVKRYEKQLHDMEAEIKRLHEEGKIKEDEFNERMDELEAEFDEKLSKIDTYVDRFARIDMTMLEESERQIISLVKEGKFEEAIKRYENEDLLSKYNKSKLERQQLADARETIEQAIDAKEQENFRLRQAIERQVNLLHLAGGKENLEKIHAILKEVFYADESNIEARRNYAFSLYTFEQHEEAISLLKAGMENCDDEVTKALMALEIADNCDEEADRYKYALYADSISTSIGESDNKAYTRILPACTFFVLKYHLLEGDMNQFAPFEKKMSEHWAPDSMDVKSIQNYCDLLNLLSTYYSIEANHEKSIWAAKESIRLYNTLKKQAPWMLNFGTAYACACSVFAIEGKYEEAKNAAINAVAFTNEQFEKIPTITTSINACSVYQMVAESLYEIGESALAQQVVNDALNKSFIEKIENREELFEQLAAFCFVRSLVETDNSNFKKAEELIDRGCEFYMRNEDSESAELYRHLYLGRLFHRQKKYNEADAEYCQAIKLAYEAYKEESDAWNADAYCCNLVHYADMLGETGKISSCKKQLKKAEKFSMFESNNIKIKAVKQKYNIK